MAIFSKPVCLDCTCYELGHCWTPYCLKASTDVSKIVFREAFKIYGSLYLITALIKKRGLRYYAKQFIPETVRSTIFLTINGTLFIALFCVWRKLVGVYIFYNTFILGIPASALSLAVEQKSRRLLGCFYFLNSSFLPAYFAAGTAILAERKSRRGPLAVYLTNLAVETGYRMLVNRGIVRPVANGEVLLFSVASAVYLYLFRKENGLPKSTQSVFKFLVGSEELPDSSKSTNGSSVQSATTTTSSSTPTSNGTATRRAHNLRYLQRLPLVRTASKVAAGVAEWMKGTPRHACCPHGHGCLHYVLRGLCKMFGIGFVVQLLIKLLSSMSALRRRPREVVASLWNTSTLGLGAFLGLYSGVYRAVNCALRWWREKDDAIHGMVAGLLAGGTMYFYKSVTVAMFSCAKLVEVMYFKGIEAGKLPHIPCADIFIYAFSTAFVFHAAVMEPHSVRPAYWKWLLRVTDNKFAYMNRRLLDVFGVNSSKLYPDYWPDYDPRFTTMINPPSS